MLEFVPRPYKLFNKIQYYEWGTKDGEAFIPKFLGRQAEPGKPYAELWIGTHPKAPSEIEIEGRRIPLNELIALYGRQSLGEYVSTKFSGRLPFLLKVLSAAHALSIQAHPNREQAVRLHASHPENYPDDNHKPEIAIAIDSLAALVGFKPVHEIVSALVANPELREFAEKESYDNVVHDGKASDREKAVRELYADIMRKADQEDRLSRCIRSISDRLSMKKSPDLAETQFLEQRELYGDDVGLLSFFFFNLVQLKPGQAIFTGAGVPHAYIKGNIVECMANSDNVVRAGLTNKFRDVETLLDIMKYEFAECKIINSEQRTDEVVYDTSAEEFRITRQWKGSGFKRVCKSNDRPSVCLIADGEIEVMWNYAGKDYLKSFSKGESFFIPASLSEFRMSSTNGVDHFLVEIP